MSQKLNFLQSERALPQKRRIGSQKSVKRAKSSSQSASTASSSSLSQSPTGSSKTKKSGKKASGKERVEQKTTLDGLFAKVRASLKSPTLAPASAASGSRASPIDIEDLCSAQPSHFPSAERALRHREANAQPARDNARQSAIDLCDENVDVSPSCARLSQSTKTTSDAADLLGATPDELKNFVTPPLPSSQAAATAPSGPPATPTAACAVATGTPGGAFQWPPTPENFKTPSSSGRALPLGSPHRAHRQRSASPMSRAWQVSDAHLTPKLREDLQRLGAEHADVVHSIHTSAPPSNMATESERGFYRLLVRGVDADVATPVRPNCGAKMSVRLKLAGRSTEPAFLLVYLCESWLDVPVREGDICNVLLDDVHQIWIDSAAHDAAAGGAAVAREYVGSRDQMLEKASAVPPPHADDDELAALLHLPFVIVDDVNNLFVLQPDIMLTGTALGDSYSCARRAVLGTHVKLGLTNASALNGTILHDVFQEAIYSNNFDPQYLTELLRGDVQRNVPALYACGGDEHAVFAELQAALPSMVAWSRDFIGPSNVPLGISQSQRVFLSQEAERAAARGNDAGGVSVHQERSRHVTIPFHAYDAHDRVVIRKVLATEENVMSPVYGLQGKLDASMRVRVNDDSAAELSVPFELKTGRRGAAVVSHRAQLLVYCMIMSERYGEAIERGLLYYTRDNSLEGIQLDGAKRRYVLIQRNRLVRHLGDRPERRTLPAPIRSQNMCARCSVLTPCMLYHRVHEDGTEESSGVPSLFNDAVGALTDADLHYFQLWDRLIALEWNEMERYRSEVWAVPAYKRERHGRCAADMSVREARRDPDTLRFEYELRRNPVEERIYGSLLDLRFGVGDSVLLSIDGVPGGTGLGRGMLAAIDHQSMRVTARDDMRVPLLNMMLSDTSQSETVRVRVDRDNVMSGFRTMTKNLLLFITGGDATCRLRRLVVHLERPTFRPDHAVSIDASVSASLNDDQRGALRRVLAADDYCLVHGMPGTGKTTTVARIVQQLVARQKTVLLVANAHQAVDNILLKLLELDVDFVRVAPRESSVHPLVRPSLVENRMKERTVAEYRRVCQSALVMATTCLSVDNAALSGRQFDYCIVDEASQLTQPVCLGPLRYAACFVLVGDHLQLTPIVRSRRACDEGMDESLFKRLSEAHDGHAIVALRLQYRMNEEIMALSNELVYDGQLRCGSEAVAGARMHAPGWRDSSGDALFGGAAWLYDSLHPQKPVVFVNTDMMPALEKRGGLNDRGASLNVNEAALVFAAVRTLLRAGVSASHIGIVSPYNAQVSLISRHLRKLVDEGLLGSVEEVEAHTVDRYQGRDKEVVIISCVRSNAEGKVGSLLSDWRRINVAVTRAKHKLVIIGSQRTLKNERRFERLLEQCTARNWLQTLPSIDFCLPSWWSDYGWTDAEMAEMSGENVPSHTSTANGGKPKKFKGPKSALQMNLEEADND